MPDKYIKLHASKVITIRWIRSVQKQWRQSAALLLVLLHVLIYFHVFYVLFVLEKQQHESAKKNKKKKEKLLTECDMDLVPFWNFVKLTIEVFKMLLNCYIKLRKVCWPLRPCLYLIISKRSACLMPTWTCP